MAQANVHLAAGLLAFLTSVPYPGIRGGPKDPLENVKWLSYSLISGTVNGSAPHVKDDSPNYLGAVLFVLYILASLYYAFRVSIKVARLAMKINDAIYPTKASFFSCLALLAFTLLSFNMFLFATNSFLLWRRDPGRIKPTSTSWYTTLGIDLSQWLLVTTPFLDFARELFRSNGGYWWSAQGLLSTILSNFYMSAAAQAYGIADALDFFILAQLLPVSFSLCLFFVAIVLRPFSKEPAPSVKRATRVLPQSASWALLVALRVLIIYLPLASARSGELSVLIIFTRVLIFSNYFVSFDSPTFMHEVLPWVVIYRLPFLFANLAVSSLEQIAEAMTVTFAVSTLGIDYIFSLATVGLYFGWDYVDRITADWAKQRKEGRSN